jgi:putative oxidoreductase
MKKINYALVSRSLIALLFVVAGYQKLKDFSGAAEGIRQIGLPFAPLVTLIVIIIEIPIALLFAYGYKTRQAGYALIAFTALTILLVHNNLSNPMNIMMILKNLAIIGGIMAAISCACGDCTVHSKKSAHHEPQA